MKQVISLNKDWKLKNFKPGEYWKLPKQPYEITYDESDWLTCNVPCDVHTCLLSKGIIEDPFFEMNAEKTRWIEECDWWFRKHFTMPEEFKNKKIELVFEGLDTFATIWLNGEKIAENEDMFLPLRIDISDKVKFGEDNVLVVKLASPILETLKRYQEKYPINIPRAFARKAQYAYGWDWATRLLTIGIWRDVRIEVLDKATIRDVYVYTTNITSNYSEAYITVVIEVEVFEEGDYSIKFQARCKEQVIEDEFNAHLSRGQYTFKREYTVKNPLLWWPRGYGEQNLYNFKVELFYNNELIDSYNGRFGIRTVELITRGTETPNGKVFYFRINGVKIFIKGANWIPLDLLITRTPPHKYRRAIEMLAEANHNAIRIWGGGLVEYDELYNACDELGIMIWHDFPYSTAYYPTDEKFLELVRKETEAIVRRLRNHPSIILWCGNNEIDWMMYNRNIEHRGHPIFYRIIPAILRKLDPSRPYWPSSPWSPEAKDPNSMEEGNRHNWYVWHGFEPIENYLKDNARFITEFGFQALPDVETLKTFLSKEKLWPPNEVWIYHWHMIHKMVYYIRDYGKPNSLEKYVLLSQLVQADALKKAIEHFRSRKFACGGCIYWNYNAPWPNMCWEVVDYYLRPKAAYFYVKRAYEPIIIATRKLGDYVEIYVVNDKLTEVNGKIVMKLIDFDGKEYFSRTSEVKVGPNESKLVDKININELPKPLNNKVLVLRLETEKEIIENQVFLARHAELAFPNTKITTSFRTMKNKIIISLYSDKYARFAYVKVIDVDPMRVKYSDNYIDILPGQTYDITIELLDQVKECTIKVGALNAPEFTMKISL